MHDSMKMMKKKKEKKTETLIFRGVMGKRKSDKKKHFFILKRLIYVKITAYDD